MTTVLGRACGIAFLLLFSLATSDTAAQTTSSLKLAVTGTAPLAGTFDGTLAVNRFETRGNQIVAIAFVSGTLTQRNGTVGTALVGEIAVPLTVRAGGVTAVKSSSTSQPQLRRIAFARNAATPELALVQATACPVVDLVLGPFDVNVLGVDVAIQPVDIQLVGEEGTPLGSLVCQVNALIGNVAGLVGVVNGILNLLISLLGGLGGIVPVP